MKRIIISLCLLFNFYQAGYSQTLLDTNKLWTNIEFASFPILTMQTKVIRISGDTLINGIDYKKMLVSTDSMFAQWTTYRYIRETSDGKVYFLLSGADTVEKLCYNFNLTPGDSVNFYCLGLPYLHRKYVAYSDSIIYFAGKWRKCLFVADQGAMERWIEGIGSLEGIIYNGTFGITGTGYFLGCYYENDTLLYQNPTWPLCYYYIVGINSLSEKDESMSLIYPNPSNGLFQIDLSDSKYKNKYNKVEVYNSTQQKVFTQDLLPFERLINIDLRFLNGGIYFVMIKHENTVIETKIIILKK